MQNKKQPNRQTKIQTPPTNNILAMGGFDLCRTYASEDLFIEPSQKRLDLSVIEYVPFLTSDNDLLDNIYAITNNSPTTASIITQKASYAMGDGLIAVPASQNEVLPLIRTLRNQDIDIAAAEALNDFSKEVNPQGESLEDVMSKVFTDLFSFGNAFVELVRIKAGANSRFYVRLMPVYMCRPKKALEGEFVAKEIGISQDWQENYSLSANVFDIPIFPMWRKDGNVERSIIHIKSYSPNFNYWGKPDWLSAKIWGELEYRIPKYNQSKFENGFTPSAIVSLFGSSTKEEANEVMRAFKSCFTGTGNNSKIFAQVLRDNSYKTDVQVLEDKNEGSFLELQQMAQQAIISAHRWTVALTGLRTAGSLGSNQQIRSEFDMVYNAVIRPVQRQVLKQINKVIDAAGEWLGNDWKGIDLDIAKAMPVSFLGDIDINTALTQDEIRQELGFEPLNNTQNEPID